MAELSLVAFLAALFGFVAGLIFYCVIVSFRAKQQSKELQRVREVHRDSVDELRKEALAEKERADRLLRKARESQKSLDSMELDLIRQTDEASLRRILIQQVLDADVEELEAIDSEVSSILEDE